MLRAYARIIHPFLQQHSTHAEQAFDIPSSKVLPTIAKRINITLEDQEEVGLVHLILRYNECSTLEEQQAKLLDVCPDIEKEIYSYLRDSLELTVQMDFRENWPFWGPKMKVLKVSTTKYNLQDTVARFNCDLRTEWSPALGFEKTLLMLMSRILEQIKYV